jgi:DNA polymerase-4/protein ImuB
VLRETLLFPEPAGTVVQFHLGLRRLLERVWARVERRGRGVRQVRIQALLEGGSAWERSLTLRQPSERWEPVFEELKRRLESVRPAGALSQLSVELTAFAARVEGQRLLFRDERQHRAEQLEYELAQLRQRLGKASVYRIVEVDPCSRLPERQYALLSYDP